MLRRLSSLLGAGLLVPGLLVPLASASRMRAADAAGPACSRPIPELFDRASPAVVLITAESVDPYRLQDRVSWSYGSGFLIQPDGLIVTSSHVVFGSDSLTVTLDDGSVLPARLVGADPIFDVALIRLAAPGRQGLPVLKLGESSRLTEGEDVFAIGNPLGLDQTVTRGIVSGLNRLLPDTPYSVQEPLIQTDAPINPGNSGGPLLNRCGEVVGMNSEIIPSAQNIGFAIPIDLVKKVLPMLKSKGRVIRPWIGFHGQMVPRDLQKLLGMTPVRGLLVETVEPDSPADRAGIQGGTVELTTADTDLLMGGDVVVAINGIAIESQDDVDRSMRALKVGGSLELRLLRRGKYRNVHYVLPERPFLPSDVPGECGDSSLSSAARAARRPHGPGPALPGWRASRLSKPRTFERRGDGRGIRSLEPEGGSRCSSCS